MEKFKFNPAVGFLDSNTFHDPNNETETREQLQTLHNQTRDFINLMQTMYGEEAIMLRLNAAKGLEYSIDGEHWEEVVGRGERGPAGPGVIPGGQVGQILQKNSDTDYDTKWDYIPVATDTIIGGAKVKGGTDSTIKIQNNTLKLNQLVISELSIENAPVQTLSEPLWLDEEGEFTKYIDVAIEGCVTTAKPDHWLMKSSFKALCGYLETRDGAMRFYLSTDLAEPTITTTIKDLIIQYQD